MKLENILESRQVAGLRAALARRGVKAKSEGHNVIVRGRGVRIEVNTKKRTWSIEMDNGIQIMKDEKFHKNDQLVNDIMTEIR